MWKTTVYLPEELKAALERAARETGCSEAELIREGILSPFVLAELDHLIASNGGQSFNDTPTSVWDWPTRRSPFWRADIVVVICSLSISVISAWYSAPTMSPSDCFRTTHPPKRDDDSVGS